VNLYQITRCHIPEHSTVHSYGSENLKFNEIRHDLVAFSGNDMCTSHLRFAVPTAHCSGFKLNELRYANGAKMAAALLCVLQELGGDAAVSVLTARISKAHGIQHLGR
jgi:hypothetical protein